MEISSALGKIWLITRPAGISGKIRFDKDGSRRGWVFSHLIIRSSKDEWTARKVREIRILVQECWLILAHLPSFNLRFPRLDRGAFCGLESQSGFVRAAPSGA